MKRSPARRAARLRSARSLGAALTRCADAARASQVNACLLPVIGGVALASAADLSFTWDCFAFAMGSNVAFSLRGVLSKKAMGAEKGENMDAGNMFAVMTTLAFLSVLPVAIAIEGPVLQEEYRKAIASGVYSETELLMRLLASGISFYLYNEVSMYTLDSVHPITHAVGNTIKRVILILFSVVRFGTPMTAQRFAPPAARPLSPAHGPALGTALCSAPPAPATAF